MAEPAIGIDLGTTYSAVAVVGPSGKPEIVPNAEGERTTASAVLFQETGPILIGQDAVDMYPGYHERGVRWVKREMGNADWSLSADGKSYSAVDVSAMILKKIKQDAEQTVGPIRRAVITVPAYFGEVRRKATMDAAKLAGLEILRLINEPTAAALAYASGGGVTGRVLIYDLGGGTFDVSIVRIGSTEDIEVLASEGDTFGGYDLDLALAKKYDELFYKEMNARLMDEEQKTIMFNTIADAETAKRKLSRMSEFPVQLQWNAHTMLASVSRDDFESLIRDHLTRTEMLVEDALEQAGLSAGDLDAVILAGGSTRIPAVKALLKKKLGLEPLCSINPDEAVALGAALQAGVLMQEKGLLEVAPAAAQSFERTQLKDVCNKSYGTLSVGDAYGGDRLRNTIIITKNTPTPCSKTKTFYTHSAGQDAIKCTVTQGDDEDPEFTDLITEGMMELPPGRPANCEIRVTYSYDANQRMSCKFLDVESGREKTFSLDFGSEKGGAQVAAQLDEAGFDDLDIL